MKGSKNNPPYAKLGILIHTRGKGSKIPRNLTKWSLDARYLNSFLGLSKMEILGAN